ncbi:hypothetical protein C8R44DRAFT_236571 [Mycena epipterygia]|nr:hypothetical protein C8R44DRAFT_236571 [Mycena epipterygia]
MSQQATSAVRAAAHSLRSVHSSSSSRATAVEPPSLTIPPIFDIFDVPAGLHASGAFTLAHARRPAPRAPAASSVAHRPPTSLPNPLVFEGPSGRSPVVRSHHELAQQQPVPYVARHGTEPVVTMFEGPAYSRRRVQHPLAGGKSVRACAESFLGG